jgi:aminoglycoside phosphotransferase (APT) family kinase protein
MVPDRDTGVDNARVLRTEATRDMRPVSGGFATSVWRVESGAGTFALRVFAAYQRSVLDRELLAMRAAAAGGVAVPRVHAVGSYDDRPAMLSEWCRGRMLLQVLRSQPWRLLQLGHAFGRLQRRIHQIPAPPELRSNWIDWQGQCEPRLADRLRQLSVPDDRLLHLDYHPLNVIAEGGRLTAVLDWTNAHGGDPRADLARTVAILRIEPAGPKGLKRLPVLALEAGWRSGYGPFGPDMAAFYAWAGGSMLNDLASRNTAEQLKPVRLWTDTWSRQALQLG